MKTKKQHDGLTAYHVAVYSSVHSSVKVTLMEREAAKSVPEYDVMRLRFRGTSARVIELITASLAVFAATTTEVCHSDTGDMPYIDIES